VLFVAELVGGSISGGITGYRLSNGQASYTLLGVLLGGPVLAFSSMAYLYAAPENIAGVSLLAAFSGGLGGLGISLAQGWDFGTAFLGVTLGANLGLLGVFLATLPIEDISNADTALMIGTAVNATAGTAIGMWLLSSLGKSPAWSTLFYVPVLGMGLGALLSLVVEMPERQATFFTGIPTMGAAFIGGMVHFVMSDGFKQKNVGPAPAIVTASSFAGLLGLSLLAGADYGPETTSEKVAIMPWAAPTGPQNRDLALGASALMRF
jgi:hypothetical protein